MNSLRFFSRRRRVWNDVNSHLSYSLIFFILFALTSCQDGSNSSATDSAIDESPISEAQQSPDKLIITYPLDQTLFPPDIVAPTFKWQDQTPEVERWQVQIQYHSEAKTQSYDVTQPHWRPDEAIWSELKIHSVDQTAKISVTGLDVNKQSVSSSTVRIQTARDPVGDAIFYREVPLPFIEAVQDPAKIRWRFGGVDSVERPPIVLENLPVCGNCHSFSRDGQVLGLDVDYGNDKGGYAILSVQQQMMLDDDKIMTWSDYKRDDGEATFGLLSQVSPDGRYVISTVKDRAVFVATPGIEFSQLFFPIKGILVVYDRVTKTYTPLPGADDPSYVQSNPTWSPDGQWIVFARAKAYQKESIADLKPILLSEHDVPEFIKGKQPYKFDLYRVPFNQGRGGTAEPIKGASHNGKSNFFAEYSPDGQWIVFTQAENYMLLMPDSELYIVPANGGSARRLRANTPRMNSWHSFSSNGRWLVFSSKANTPYTQLFLTHINEQGESTPAVLLERFTGEDRAANIPEFVPLATNAIATIKEQFLDAYSFLRAGMANERTGNYRAAVKAYERGLESEPENVELLNALGFALFQQGHSRKASTALQKALEIDPKHWKAHNNMALASIDLGELELAEAHYRESLAIEPQAAIYNDLGFVLERLGMSFEAADMYRESLSLDSEFKPARYNLATALLRGGEHAQAEQHFRLAIRQNWQKTSQKNPNSKVHTGLGIALLHLGQSNQAIASFKDAIAADPKNAAPYDQLSAILIKQGRWEEVIDTYKSLIEHNPSASAHDELAQVLFKLDRNDEAREHKTQAAMLKQSEAKPSRPR